MQIIENLKFIAGGNQDLQNIDLGDISILPVDLTKLKDVMLEKDVSCERSLNAEGEEIITLKIKILKRSF